MRPDTVHPPAAKSPREGTPACGTFDVMDTDASLTTENRVRRRGRPVARVTMASPKIVEMDEVAFEAAVEAMANVLRLDWDLAGVLDDHRPI